MKSCIEVNNICLCFLELLNQGTRPLVDDIQQAQLWQALQEKAPDGGLWNERKVADWLSEVSKNVLNWVIDSQHIQF